MMDGVSEEVYRNSAANAVAEIPESIWAGASVEPVRA